MSIYQWLCLFSVPAIVLALFKLISLRIKKQNQELQAVKLGIQALLRAQLISDYNKWSDKGYAPIYARQNFENCWFQYHALGKNGVMDDLHMKFFELPTEPQEQREAGE